MRELCDNIQEMFKPQFVITNNILKYISDYEYYASIVENTKILPKWRKQLNEESTANNIYYAFELEDKYTSIEEITKHLKNLPSKITGDEKFLLKNFSSLPNITTYRTFNERELKAICELFVKKAKYRSKKISNKTNPQEILAEVTQLLDWLELPKAREVHPLILAAILRTELERIYPFESHNNGIIIMCTLVNLLNDKKGMFELVSIEKGFSRSRNKYESELNFISKSQDYTDWIEYFTQTIALEIQTIAEKISTVSQDNATLRVSADSRLSDRQEIIIDFICEYGFLQNKDFSSIFPKISEDTVLREIKDLIDRDIVVKVGKTKSTRYELS